MKHPVLLRLFIMLVVVMTLSSCAQNPFAPTPEPITLRFAYRAQTVDIQRLLDDFHAAYPWITVEPVEVRRFGTSMRSVIEGASVDVFRDSQSALSLVQSDLLLPLDEVHLSKWSDIRDDYFPGSWEALSIEGVQWGIPAGLDMLVMYVNVDQAQALGVDIAKDDWTLTDFLEMANELNYPEGLPYNPSQRLFGFCTTPQGMDPLLFVYLHGGRIVDDINNPSQALLDDPLTLEGTQFYVDLFNRYGVAPDPATIRANFRRGGVYEAAVRGFCGIWSGWYSNRGGQDTPFQWTSAWQMLPLPKDKANFDFGEVEGYFITRNSQHPEEALTLLRFLADHWEAAGQKLPPRKSQVASKAYEDHVGEEIAAIARTFGQHEVIIVPAQLSDQLEFVGGQFLSAINEMITQDLDAYEVLPEVQQRVQNVFASP